MTSDCTIVTLEQHLYQTIVQLDETIVLARKLAIGNIHDYLFWYCPLVGILFEVLRIDQCGIYDNILPEYRNQSDIRKGKETYHTKVSTKH